MHSPITKSYNEPPTMFSYIFTLARRRKCLICTFGLTLIIGIWALSIFYIASIRSRSLNNSKGILPVVDFDSHRGHMVARYIKNAENVKGGVDTLAAMGIGERFERFKSFFLSKNAKRIMDSPVKDTSNPLNKNENRKVLKDEQKIYEQELQKMGIPVVPGLGPRSPGPPKQRLVHLDLKGAPPKISYIKRLLPIFKSLGATGLLIEYEDMFPYEGTIYPISARNAYSKAEVTDLLHSIARHGMSVMPLVQTFGHLEFALKLQQFQNLREVFESPQSICPNLNESVKFLEMMITQMVELHLPNFSNQGDGIPDLPVFTHLHIGCDEVYRMGECPRCKDKERNEIFLSHVKTVANFVRLKWPHLKVVIWDDMLRQMRLADLQQSDIGRLVEPMVWVYTEDIYRFVPMQTWDKYATVFPTVWAASAFKGAHGETLTIPPLRRHLENNLRWISLIHAEGFRFSNGIQGLVLTGWQRYDHFAVLCELLPPSIPSLAICLSTVSKGYFEIDAKLNNFMSALTCAETSQGTISHRPWLALGDDPDLTIFAKCMYPGSQSLRFVTRLESSTAEAREYLTTIRFKRGWLTDNNIRHNFSSPIRVDELTFEIGHHLNTLLSLTRGAYDVFGEIYPNSTIDEFVAQIISPIIRELYELQTSARQLMSLRVWPRRPIPYIVDNNMIINDNNNNNNRPVSN